jgi:hypothetical protein
MRHYDVMIDRRGWAQNKRRASWRPSERSRTNARRDLPWTTAEDRALLRRVAGANSIGYADPTLRAAEVAHGRSYCAIATRLAALKAGIRLAMAAKGTTKRSAAMKKGN